MKHTFKPLLWAFSCLLSLSPFLGAQAQTPCSDRVMRDITFQNQNDPSATKWTMDETGISSYDFTFDTNAYSYSETFNSVKTPQGGNNNTTRQYAVVKNPHDLNPQFANINTDGMLVINPLQNESDNYFTINVGGLIAGQTYYIEMKLYNVVSLDCPGMNCGGGWSNFDNAFREFPFSIQTVYFGPQFSGPANLMYFNPCEETATMTGFPYEDVNSWKGPYSSDILEVQFKKLSEKWKNGLDILLKEMDCSEIADIAEACYDIFRSSYNQIKYVRLKQQHAFDEIIGLLDEEQQLAESPYNITLRRPEVGYEAANHYVFTPGMCLEKVLNCKRLKQEFSLHNS